MVQQQHKKPKSLGSGTHPRSSSKAAAAASTSQPKASISKLKSNLRQVKRLLLKPQLDASVKRDALRRQTALSSELERALSSSREKQMAQKYHMVKFFERRKVERALGRAKRLLAAAKAEGSKGKKKLERELLERRVDLNYIMHYPKAKKYVSLLRETTQEGERQRTEVRDWVRGAMERGELSAEPEVEKSSVVAEPVRKPSAVKKGASNARAKDKEEDGFFEPGEAMEQDEDADQEEREAEEEEEAEEMHELEDLQDQEEEDGEDEDGDDIEDDEEDQDDEDDEDDD